MSPYTHARAICAALTGAAMMSVCALGPLPAGSAPPVTGLAYDEVTKLVLGGETPEPGTFSADFEAAVNAQRSMATAGGHRGLFGGIMNGVDMAKNAIALMRSGTASTRYFLSGWERTDEPGAQTAVIHKPQQHQIIFLNLEKKTYRVVDMNALPPNMPPPPTDSSRGGPRQPPEPGTGKLSISVSSTVLGPRVIENTPTTGYKVTFNMTESQSTGSCTDGTFQTSMVEYVSRYVQPRVAASRVAMTRPMRVRPEMMALKPGCTPTISMHSSGGAQPPSDRLALWTLITIAAGAPTAQGQMSGGFSTVIERGNLRALGTGDKNMFDIPAGFTLEQ